MDTVTLSIVLPAFCAGLAILLSHVPLGIEVIRRGIIFIDIAIAQIVGLGIVLASSMGFDAHGVEIQLIALASALVGAFVLSMLEKFSGNHQEAVIGIAFVLSATLSILLLADNAQGGEELKSMLVGQILWSDWQDMIIPGVLGLVVLLINFVFPKILQGKAFYYVFAVLVTFSVQLIGVYLVFASLILPALAIVLLHHHLKVFLGILIGVLGYGLGLWLSATYDLPSGPMIVWLLAVVSFVTAVILKVKINKKPL